MKDWRRLAGLSRQAKTDRPGAARLSAVRPGETRTKTDPIGHARPLKKPPVERLPGRHRRLVLAGLYMALIGALLYINQQLWLSEARGINEVKRLQAEVAQQKTLNAQLLARNEQLRHEVMSLKQGADALEERARYDLGMIREGETLIKLIPVDPK